MKFREIKNLFPSLIFVLTLCTIALLLKDYFEQTTLAQSLDTSLKEIQKTTNLPTFETNPHQKASIEPGASNISSAVYYIFDFLKLIVGSIAIIMLVQSGIRLVIARKHIDEVWPKQKEHFIMIATGLVILFIADVVVNQVFFGTEGEIFESQAQAQEAAQQGAKQLKGMYNVVTILIGILAVFMLVVSGIRLLTSANNEEAQTKVKKQIIWIVLGLFLIGVAEFVVQDFIFPEYGSQIPSSEKGAQLIVSFTNFISAFVSIVSILFAIYAGFLYVTAAGNDENVTKAKKVLIGVVIAIILSIGAFAIVNTVIQLEANV